MPRRWGPNTGIPGLAIPWRLALAVSQAKAKRSRQLGIPLSKRGHARKVGRFLG